MQEYMEIGQIVNTQGLKGVMKVNPFTDDMTRFEKLNNIYVVEKQGLKEYKIQEVRYNKSQVLLKLKGIDTIEEAELRKGCYLKIDKKDAISLPEDTYFIADLIGLEVYTLQEEFLRKYKRCFSNRKQRCLCCKRQRWKTNSTTSYQKSNSKS